MNTDVSASPWPIANGQYTNTTPDVWYRLDEAALADYPAGTLIQAEWHTSCPQNFLAMYRASCNKAYNDYHAESPLNAANICPGITEVQFTSSTVPMGGSHYAVFLEHRTTEPVTGSGMFFVRAGMTFCTATSPEAERLRVRVVAPGAGTANPEILQCSGSSVSIGDMESCTDSWTDANHPGGIDKFFVISVPAGKKVLVKASSDSTSKSVRLHGPSAAYASPVLTTGQELPWLVMQNIQSYDAWHWIIVQTATDQDSCNVEVQCLPLNWGNDTVIQLDHNRTILGDLTIKGQAAGSFDPLSCYEDYQGNDPTGWFQVGLPAMIQPPSAVRRVTALFSKPSAEPLGLEMSVIPTPGKEPSVAACDFESSGGGAQVSHDIHGRGPVVFLQPKTANVLGMESLSVAVTVEAPGVTFGNDDCTSAMALHCGDSIAAALTTYATTSTLDPPPGCLPARDVWFRVSIPDNEQHLGSYVALTFADDPHTFTMGDEYEPNTNYLRGYVAVYRGSPCSGSPQLVDWRCGRIYDEFRLAPIALAPGDDYYIRVASNSNSPDQMLTITCTPKTP